MTGSDSGMIIQERDRHLLRELAVMRVADREQIKRAVGFRSTTRVNVRLLALTSAGFLRRFFLGTVGGARKALYSVSAKGAALVEVPFRGPRRAQNQTLAADFFLSHQLAINEIYCRLKFEPIPVNGGKFVRWSSFYDPLSTGSALIPDGYFEIATSTKPLVAFLEVDLGHESRAVWQRKVGEYLQYAVSGSFTKQFGHPQYRVLVIANSERRLKSLCLATAPLTHKIFWFAALDSINRDGFWSPIWRRAATEQGQSLL